MSPLGFTEEVLDELEFDVGPKPLAKGVSNDLESNAASDLNDHWLAGACAPAGNI